MHKIRLSKAAEHDLENIWDYTLSTWGEAQATLYLAQIEKGFLELLDNPYIGKARPDIKNGYRALLIEKHIVFYVITDAYIDILGIPHARMDIKQHFED